VSATRRRPPDPAVPAVRPGVTPVVGDAVIPAQWAPPRGRVVARDVRGGEAGALVCWHPGEPARWVPDHRLAVLADDRAPDAGQRGDEP
jgi:hypothetical protein